MNNRPTIELAKFVAALSYEIIPPKVIEKAKSCLLDAIGVAIGGSSTDSGKSAQAFAKEFGKGEATLMGSSDSVPAIWASLANGVATHSLEMDDTNFSAMLHASATMVPVAVALAEEYNISGKDMLTALIAGYEVAIRIAKAGIISCDDRGFHATAICNGFGAAAVASKIFGLNEEQTIFALAIAAHQASGINEFLSDDSWTKRLHPGWAAHAGITAAMLGKNNFRAEKSALEGDKGFFNAYYNKYDLACLTEGLNYSYEILNINVKPYACCARIHTAIEATIEIMKENNIKATDVDTIEVAINSRDMKALSYPEEIKTNPKSIVDAQFSIPYVIAAGVLFGEVSVKQFTTAIISSADMRKYLKKVKVAAKESYNATSEIWPATVTITTSSGKEFRKEKIYVLGSSTRPMSWEQLIGKFMIVGSLAKSQEVLTKIPTYLKFIETEANIKKLSELLRGQ